MAVEKLRHTPAGLPRRRLWIEHRSRQIEAGGPREVLARLPIVIIGEELVTQAGRLTEGQEVLVSGFLARAGHQGDARDRLQLHVQNLELRVSQLK